MIINSKGPLLKQKYLLTWPLPELELNKMKLKDAAV